MSEHATATNTTRGERPIDNSTTTGRIFYWGVLLYGLWTLPYGLSQGFIPATTAPLIAAGLLYRPIVRGLLGTPKWFAHASLAVAIFLMVTMY